MSDTCIFCKIVRGEIPSHKVYENDDVLVFLDNGPLFPGHALVCPKQHVDTMADLPASLLAPLFGTAQLVTKAVEKGLNAQGSFVAVNNKVSQSVPHLHVHVIPRTRGDGLKGFFWPRRPYRDAGHASETASQLRRAIEEIVSAG